jgi:uncharacterized protein
MRSRTDVVVFSTAAAVVGLHAVVDSFVAPEPGTTPADHALRAFATLAVLGVSVAVYPRLRAGGRAALAAAFGVLAIEGAVLATADAFSIGARGEDWTGFFLWLTGTVLLGTAAVLLWRSRKPGRLRYLRRGAVGIGVLLGAYWLLVPVGVAILATHRPRTDVAPADLGRPVADVELRTRDGLDLAAWYVRPQNGAVVISYPTRQGKLAQARMLVRHGYGVLLVDARGYDGSEGDPNAFGWAGARDIAAAVDWLEERPEVADGDIGGIGFSVGGEAMIQAAASTPGLRAIVSEGAGTRSVREALLHGWRGWLALPEAAVQTAAVAVLSGTQPPSSLAKLTPLIAPRPLLLVYAGRGGGGEELTPVYFEAAGEPKMLWKIEEAEHVGGFQARPHEYENRIVGFFDDALLGTG